MGTSSISIAYLPTQFSIGYNGINKSPTEYIFFLYTPTLVFVLATSESSLQTCLENILTPCTCDDVETCQYVEGEYVKVRLTSPAIESFHSIDKVIRVEETNRVSDRRLSLSLFHRRLASKITARELRSRLEGDLFQGKIRV